MKRLSEFQAERDEVWKKEAAAHQERCRTLLASIEAEDIPIYTPLVPIRNHAADDRVQIRNLLREGSVIPIELACDHCGTELVNRRPGWYASQKPMKISIGCPGCGWSGWMRA